uniref:Uncharacterized protein n=1 Tax=viral metagenome TaxID=1070528 RepID=A0A6C0C556_9ZZZZ
METKVLEDIDKQLDTRYFRIGTHGSLFRTFELVNIFIS